MRYEMMRVVYISFFFHHTSHELYVLQRVNHTCARTPRRATFAIARALARQRRHSHEPVFYFYFFSTFPFWLIPDLTDSRSRDPHVGCNNPHVIIYLAICCCNRGVLKTVNRAFLFRRKHNNNLLSSPSWALSLALNSPVEKALFLKYYWFYINFVGDRFLSE